MPHAPDPRPATLVELRVLDGPNLYFPRAAVKVVLDVRHLLELPDSDFVAATAQFGAAAARPGRPGTDRRLRTLARALASVARRLAGLGGAKRLAVRSRPGPEPGQLTIAFPWRQRAAATRLAVALAEVVAGRDVLEAGASVASGDPGERPVTPRPTIPVVAVTGTNGKTTTTRLIAHMGRCAGLVVGWSNTDGIWIDGECVEAGDWSGYGGAGRVLADRRVRLAVLETARGGLLLRGAGAAHNDVSVVTNVSADHLGLLGIATIDELAEVKAIVPRMTKPSGWCVLNADDPRTLAMRAVSRARPFVFSPDPDSPGIRAALSEGGQAMTVTDGCICAVSGAWDVDELVPVLDVPMSLSGLSSYNVANALAGAAAGLAVGLPREAVVAGLRTFAPDPSLNPGRLNLYDVRGVAVVLDLAHNEDSLLALLQVAEGLRLPGAQLVTVVGTAGDRPAEMIRTLGEIAARRSDHAVIAHKDKYLRGRSREEITTLLLDGLRLGGITGAPVYPDELSGLQAGVHGASSGDVVAFMCHADRAECDAWLIGHGAVVMSADAVRQRVLLAAGPGPVDRDRKITI
ncbi:MAG TPA: Mur ligase family protein [Mycobacteriales bacterium]|nr:Mur ligase family protein [Mycobacteriales bacterium]